MIRLLTMLCLLGLLMSCKTETKDQNNQTETISEVQKELTTAELIAKAHGFEHWKTIEQIDFTFNVDRGENHFERTWSWQPKEDYVVSTISKDSITMYTRGSKAASEYVNVDRSFINDKYWLFVPFQLIWDEGATISEPVNELAPISKTELNKITITYGNEGGYTPGDAYDIFYDNEYMIQEWVFRKGNAVKPTMITTFENYEVFNGIKIAKDHKMAEGNFNLYFSNIKVK